MKCEICKNDIGNTIVLLPIKKPDGCLDTIACLKCAENSSTYCKKHKRPHLGFADDDTTACILCIEEVVAEKRSQEISIFNTLKEHLPPGEWEDLVEWADLSSSITGNSQATCVLRAITTKALRLNVLVDKIITQILETNSVDVILPKALIYLE